MLDPTVLAACGDTIVLIGTLAGVTIIACVGPWILGLGGGFATGIGDFVAWIPTFPTPSSYFRIIAAFRLVTTGFFVLDGRPLGISGSPRTLVLPKKTEY